ncbi:polysaccharide deacetylase family protein [Agrobacterium sp. AGB01]|nr:polysaccharide deacetylase family protein [Agrobacterium sp. AGB01]MBD9387224.1 polysaccharide deacetylase family protein [Agrobacterium sp. AGB01]
MVMRRLFTVGLVVLGLGGGLFGLYTLGNSRTTQLFGEIFARVETSKPLVALTFDDGPTVRFTQDVLDLLKEHDVPATFFLTGREMQENPAQARSIVEAGHQVGNHSYTHSRMLLTGPATVADEIERTDAAIRDAGYQGEIDFRPPYGKKLVTLPWYLSQNNRKTITWDIEPESYPDIAGNADAMATHVLEKAQNGSIILLHVMYRSGEASRAAVPKIVEGLRQRGFEFVTVSQLLASRADEAP